MFESSRTSMARIKEVSATAILEVCETFVTVIFGIMELFGNYETSMTAILKVLELPWLIFWNFLEFL